MEFGDLTEGGAGLFNERAAGEQLKKRNVIKISNVFLVLDVSVAS